MQDDFELSLLCRVGLLALCKRMDDKADIILANVSPRLNDPVRLDISSAIIYTMRGDKQYAIDLLRRRLLDSPQNDILKAILGLLLLGSEQQGWREIFGEILATSFDSKARGLVQEGLRIEQHFSQSS